MLTRTEAERLAAATHALRPDWPISSLMTLLGEYRDRAYRDLAIALAYIATDAATVTPGRLREAGPWWRVTEEQRAVPVGKTVMCPEHPDHPAGRCQPCKDGRATPEQIAAARALARQYARKDQP